MRKLRRLSLTAGLCLTMSAFSLPLLAISSANAAGVDPEGTIYVADYGTSSVDVFAAGANGNVAPIRTISGALTGISGPGDVAVNSAGDVFSSNFNSDTITEYAPGASGNVAPICTISGSNTGLDENDDISLAPDGTLYVGNFAGTPVVVFAPGACGNVTPLRTIAGPLTDLSLVDGLGVDASGTLYADNTDAGSVEVFSPGANGNVAPERTIGGSNTGLSSPDDVKVGFGGNLYVSDSNNSVETFAPGASGNVAPTTSITGPSTGLTDTDDLAIDAFGNIYVTNFNSSGVVEFAPGSTGNVAPIATIAGSLTTFSEPEGVAVAGPPGPPVGASVTTSGAASSISLGNSTSDTAIVSGGTSPTGSLVFKLFGPNDPTCSLAPAYTSPEQTVKGDGSYPSPSFVPTATGTYDWQALYSGDTNNAPVTTACGASGETVTVAAKAASTTISTSLSGGDQSGPSVKVPAGTAVTDTATLTGTSATIATGTVTYDVYSNPTCTSLALTGTAQMITTPGILPASPPATVTTPGTYYWQASYSGDSINSPSASTCGGEVETVTAAATSLQLYISAPYQDNGVTVVSLWWTAPPGATSFSLTASEHTGIGPYSYTATGLPQSGPSTPFIVQVEGSTPLLSATFQVTDNEGESSNIVSYP